MRPGSVFGTAAAAGIAATGAAVAGTAGAAGAGAVIDGTGACATLAASPALRWKVAHSPRDNGDDGHGGGDRHDWRAGFPRWREIGGAVAGGRGGLRLSRRNGGRDGRGDLRRLSVRQQRRLRRDVRAFRGAAQSGGELVGGLKALVRALGQRLAYDSVHGPGHLHVEPRRRQRVFLQHLVHGGGGRAAERALAGQELVEDDAGREQVRAAVDGEPHDLLGRHVARRAKHRAHLGHVRRLDVRDAEIGDLDAAVLEQDDIGRLDVAVNDAEPVRVAQRVEDLRHHPHDVGGREPLVRLEVALELAAANELHCDVPDAFVLADFVDRDDVGVRQPSGGLRLAAKAGDHRLGLLARELIRANRLERDDALDHGVESFVDDTHRATAELAADLVLADPAHLRHASLRGGCRSPVGRRSNARTPAARRRLGRAWERCVTCTCCRFPTRSSGSAAGPWCPAKRRPAATARCPSPTSTSRRPPSSPRCSRWRAAPWSRH